MKKTSRTLAGILAVGLAVSACGEQTGPGGTTLPEAEALTIGASMVAFGFVALAQAFAMPSPPASASAAADPITPIAYPCEGGSGQATGDVTDVGGAYDAAIAVNMTDCGFQTGSGLFMVSTNPALNITGSNLTTGTGTVTMSGGFNWNGGGESGTCQLNFTINLSQANAQGTICGFNLNSTAG